MGPCLVYAGQHLGVNRSFVSTQELQVASSGSHFRVGQLVDQVVKLSSIRHIPSLNFTPVQTATGAATMLPALFFPADVGAGRLSVTVGLTPPCGAARPAAPARGAQSSASRRSPRPGARQTPLPTARGRCLALLISEFRTLSPYPVSPFLPAEECSWLNASGDLVIQIQINYL